MQHIVHEAVLQIEFKRFIILSQSLRWNTKFLQMVILLRNVMSIILVIFLCLMIPILLEPS